MLSCPVALVHSSKKLTLWDSKIFLAENILHVCLITLLDQHLPHNLVMDVNLVRAWSRQLFWLGAGFEDVTNNADCKPCL